jgi:hypothetical protein
MALAQRAYRRLSEAPIKRGHVAFDLVAYRQDVAGQSSGCGESELECRRQVRGSM